MTKTARRADPLDIPEFLLVKNRQAPTPEAQARIDEAARAAGQRVEGEAENPEHVALRAAYGHPLPRSVDWDWLRRLIAKKQEAREGRKEARAAARADLTSLAEIAEQLGERQADVKRALARDPKTLSPEARKVHRRLPRLAATRHFEPADVEDVCLAARSGLEVLREAGGLTAARRARIRRTDGRVSFRAVVLDLRTERPEWAKLSRVRVLPALVERWPQLEAEQAFAPGEVEAAKAVVRAWLSRPGAAGKAAGRAPATAPLPAHPPLPASAPQPSQAAAEGGPARGKAARTKPKAGKPRRVRRRAG